MTDRESLSRRAVLQTVVGTGLASAAGCSALESESDDAASTVEGERAAELARRFAPTLYFDRAEPWFPTDPRPYTSEQDGTTIVDGFDAFNGYHDRMTDGEPPDPTAFYNVVEYEQSPLAVVQFWFYSAFDQFTTNFHWHDWEVLHVFVDTETDNPQLYVASSHSRKVPNNEFLDPDPEMVPRILSELGSHSSALSVNDIRDRFTRLPEGDRFADITNSAVETIEDLAEIPVAYGLPRDEGSRLPYLVPAYEGAPLYEHDRLPSVSREDLISASLTVRSFDSLSRPPSDLPTRETGLVFQHVDRGEADPDIEYDLVPSSELEHITDFTGPQLSFEFAVPEFVEDAVAGHITTTGAPWNQPRYENPAVDISEPNHRAALAERYEAIGAPAEIRTLIASLSEAVSNDDAPEGDGITTEDTTVESVALLESDPEAVPTSGGLAVIQDVPAGEHRFTVNGAGVAPHSETVSVPETSETEGPTRAGVDGEVPLVARENATRLEVDPTGADSDLTDLAVDDDFAGRLYDAPLSEPDAVYVHGGGAYTTEVRDSDEEIGAFRVNPDPQADTATTIDRPRTGKASLASFLADIAEETRQSVLEEMDDDGDTDDDDDDNPGSSNGSENAIQGLERALAAVVEAAKRATERAEAGDRGNADKQLQAVADRLQRVASRIEDASDDLSDPLSNAARKRLEQADRRTEQAQAADKL
ncbi:hypothetical protein SAMN05443574_101252 [Haloarcula vallismortis]|uniref:Lipoprotein n=2 Tax=Haloarcula vallismortis TaxID=28442 RepID=M0IVS0_HALVA|nr:hypothetical protein [Haloarcula vallismortis]EMA00831.1 hypothetical protein C437_18572 [Haloarcula vallismortis ATCC 29715]SDW07026.1 hypothetical protein SAMN05443574_101252 [Haloarcula vallismortis]